jgi:hypothetical protein
LPGDITKRDKSGFIGQLSVMDSCPSWLFVSAPASKAGFLVRMAPAEAELQNFRIFFHQNIDGSDGK